MARKLIEFERAALYEQIWAHPMIHVAAEHSISDVALRKICVKLKIPLPETDHWANLAAGNTPPRTALAPTDGPTVHTHIPLNRYVDDDVLARLLLVLKTFPASVTQIPEVTLHTSIEACEPIIQRMAARQDKAPKDQRGWPSISGSDVFTLIVSPQMQTHALLVLDALARCAVGSGFELIEECEGDLKAHFRIKGQGLAVRLTERAKRSKRELTPDESRLKKVGDLYWIPNEFDFSSSGELKLEVFSLNNQYQGISTTSKVVSPLADRIGDTVQRMVMLAAELMATQQVKTDHQRLDEVRIKRDNDTLELGSKCLSQLDNLEQAAVQLDRAKVLRSLAQACRSNTEFALNNPELPDWIDGAADWLDPLILHAWPDVDEAISAGLLKRDSKWRRVKLV